MKVESLEQQIAKRKEQIAKEQERLKQLQAQKQAAIAREKKKVTEQQRKDDTRRKVLIGAMFLKDMQEDESKKQEVTERLNNYLTEQRDRQLFGL